MRWLAAIGLMLTGIMFWLFMLIADPYTAWGLGYEEVRPSVAKIGINLGLAALTCFLATIAILFSTHANRTSKYARRTGGILLFFIATTLARLFWVQFIVLGWP